MYYPLLILAGVLGGFIAGFLGGGGGIIYILVLPTALHAALGVDGSELATFTVANSIFGIAFTTFFGNIAHLKLKSFYLREVLMVGLPGALTSLLTLHYFVNTPRYTAVAFNVIVVLLLLFALINGLQSRFLNETDHTSKYGLFDLFSVGGISGAISAMSGLGGGIVLIPLLKHWLKMGIMKAKSISLGMIFLSTLSMSLFNLLEKTNRSHPYTIGLIVLPVVVPVVIGVLVGSPLGVYIAHRLKARVVNRAFLVLMAIVFIKKVYDLLLVIT